MSHVRRWHLPAHVLCGDPPKRLISKLDVYVNGAVVGHGVGVRRIVFPNWADALHAVRSTLDDARAWYGEDVETSDIPCTSCFQVVSRIDDHRPFCATRKAVEAHHRGGVMLATVLAPAPVVDAVPFRSRDLATEGYASKVIDEVEDDQRADDLNADDGNEELPVYPMEPEDHPSSQDVFVAPHEDAQPTLSTDPLFLKSLQEYVSEPKSEAPEIDPHVIDGDAFIGEL